MSIVYRMICSDTAKGVTKEKEIVTELLVEEDVTGRNQSEHVGDPYDDVYRTLLEDCPQLLIPLVNEIFGEHFTKEDEVVFTKDVHILKGQEEGGTFETYDGFRFRDHRDCTEAVFD